MRVLGIRMGSFLVALAWAVILGAMDHSVLPAFRQFFGDQGLIFPVVTAAFLAVPHGGYTALGLFAGVVICAKDRWLGDPAAGQVNLGCSLGLAVLLLLLVLALFLPMAPLLRSVEGK